MAAVVKLNELGEYWYAGSGNGDPWMRLIAAGEEKEHTVKAKQWLLKSVAAESTSSSSQNFFFRKRALARASLREVRKVT